MQYISIKVPTDYFILIFLTHSPAGPARIVSEPQPKTVAQGTNVTLTCEAKGSPTPGIVWLKDGSPLPSNSRIRHHENLYESTIYINDIQISDNG